MRRALYVVGMFWALVVAPVLALSCVAPLAYASVFNAAWADICFYAGTAVVATNAPIAFQEFNSTALRREAAWLAPFTECRDSVGGSANGAAGSLAVVRYSTDGGTNFFTLATAPLDSIASTSVGTWQAIPAAAKADVILQFGTSNGDAAADPSIGSFHLQCRHQ